MRYYCCQGATCLARSLKVVNEALTSVDLGFNEIRVKDSTTLSHIKHCKAERSYYSVFV